MGAVIAKVLLWCALIGGVVGAAVAINALHVNGAVASLIVAFVAGLVLLRLRPAAQDAPDPDTAAP